MSRQERTARATRAADKEAVQVITAAVQRIKCRQCGGKGVRVDGTSSIDHTAECPRAEAKPARVPRQRPAKTDAKATTRPAATAGTTATATAGTADPAAECKRLRDEEGMAWWRIGFTLGLPGSADNVKTGKSGAAAARRLYAQANGGSRPTASRGQSVRKPAVVRHEANSGSKVDRKMTLLEQGHVIPRDMPDEEVLALVRGRTIEWGINIATLCGGEDQWMNQEARVHPDPDWVIIEEEPAKDGSRVLRFREYAGTDQHGNKMSGPTRTIRVDRIHTVR